MKGRKVEIRSASQTIIDLVRGARFTGDMKPLLPVILAVGLMACGCSLFKKSETVYNPWPDTNVPPPSTNAVPPSALANVAPVAPSPAPANNQKLIVTPGSGYSGRVDTYNDAGNFVVLDFPISHVPPTDQRLFIYRDGAKVGEIKITGPQKENHTVADLVQGEARKGDEVRDK